jgi:hypothetical protein
LNDYNFDFKDITIMWTINTLKNIVCNWDSLDDVQAEVFLTYMNQRFPPDVFQSHLDKRRRALENAAASKKLLDGAVQSFPDVVNYHSLNLDGDNGFGGLSGFAIVFTAGGEGERLRLSLLEKGVPADSLRDFTKATYPLKGFYEDFGALQINLAMVCRICRQYNIDIPVIVTTGPEGSVTDRVIPAILRKHNDFGLPHVKVVSQDERLHFTVDEKIAVRFEGGAPYPITQPDETGGPLMKLKQKVGSGGINSGCNDGNINNIYDINHIDNINNIHNIDNIDNINNISTLQWLSGLGCEKLLIVQGTAIYEPKMLAFMSAAARGHDCVGVGIPRDNFGPKDPFGTFVCIDRGGARSVCIVEQDIRNDETRSIRDRNTGAYLPFNTGFYAVDRNLLENNDLPDYATPPKEVLPGLPRSPKIGYAATDILPLAKRPLILTVSPDMYAVIKTAEDLETMSETAVRFGLRPPAAPHA